MLRPFTRCAYNSVGLVPKICRQFPVGGHHFARRMNSLAVARRVRSDLGSFLPRTACALEVLTDLLTAWTGGVEGFLRISLDLRRAAPPRRNLASEVAQF